MSVYALEYGAKAQQKETIETTVLSYKKFSELPLAVVLTDNAKAYLDTWLGLGDLELYKACVLQCLRSLYALIKIQAVTKSTYSGQFQYNKALVTPVERIDKRLFAKTSVVTKKASPAKKEAPAEEKIMATTAAAGPSHSLLKPSSIREELLRGNGNITGSCFVPEKESVYQGSFK